MPFDISPDEIWDDLHRYDDEGSPVWTYEEIAAGIEEIFDEHRQELFRAKLARWSNEHWIDAESNAFRIGTEARSLLVAGSHGPAVVWAATCTELIVRDLTLKPIFIGLFLAEEWADQAVQAMLRGKWLSKEVRKLAKAVLHTVADLDVDEFEWQGHVIWQEIPGLIDARHKIVHNGAMVEVEVAQRSVDVVAGLYASLVPTMRDLCGVTAIEGYAPPEQR